MMNPWRDAWLHAIALDKALRGRPEFRHVEGLIRALQKLRGEPAKTR